MATGWPLVLVLAVWLVGCGVDRRPETQIQGTAGGPTACPYPPPPHGKQVGDVLGDGTAWEGFPAHSSEPGVVDIRQFHDCDGAEGIHALLLVTVTFTCHECQQHLAELESRMGTWEPMGVRIVALVANGSDGAATVDDAQAWKSAVGLDALAVVADPSFSLVLESDVGYPNQVLVDPRTMMVVQRRTGFDDDYSALEELLADNSNEAADSHPSSS